MAAGGDARSPSLAAGRRAGGVEREGGGRVAGSGGCAVAADRELQLPPTRAWRPGRTSPSADLNPPTRRWCCAWTNSRRRRWNARRRYCPCSPASRKSAATTTSGTAPPRCSPRWRPPPARTAPATPGTGTASLIPQAGRQGLPAGAAAHRLRQLRHPHAPGRTGLAGQAPEDHAALHADVRVVAESRGGLRHHHPAGHPPRQLHRVADLIAAIETFIDGWNDRCHPFTWTKTADDIFAKCRPGRPRSHAPAGFHPSPASHVRMLS